MNGLDWRTPALVGGAIAGALSALPITTTCCCLWGLVGGIVAAKMLIDRSPHQVRSGDGAKIGLYAGLIGTAIFVVIGIPLSLLFGDFSAKLAEGIAERVNDPNVQESVRQMLENMRQQSVGERLVGSIFSAVFVGAILIVFTLLGGLLGVAMFEKRRDQPPPTQYPPNYPPNYPPQSGPYGGGPGGGQGGWPSA
jgi:hypothetical protein